ncbi:MAG: hypothetical protein LQ351_000239 [Letrouitia transgressa]|nr:MAG: hypothetical protein LQ351_000239 [Letrouitia transgressa]
MSGAPFAVGGPIAAYVDAKTHFTSDLYSFAAVVRCEIASARREARDQVNLFYTLEKHALAKKTAGLPFLVYEGKQWTYREVYDISLRHGQWLKTRFGIAPKEVVALDFMNSAVFIFLWMGLWSIGAYPAFINYNLSGKALLHCVTTSAARVVLIDERVSSHFTADALDFPSLKSPEMVVYTTPIRQEVLSYQPIRLPDSCRSGDLLHHMGLLIFTSGTTGFPKAAVVSWRKMILCAEWVTRWLGLARTDRVYTCMPLFHTTAALLGFCATLVCGCTLIIGHRFSNRTYWSEVRTHGATVVQYVGETLRYLLAAPPQRDPTTGEDLDRKNKVRLAYGNGLRSDIWEEFQERFGVETVAEFYSATESTSATWNICNNGFRVGAIGFSGLLASFLLRSRIAIVKVDWENETPLRDPQKGNFCTRVPRGEPGELLFRIRDPSAIEKEYQGYFQNSIASQSKIMNNVIERGDAYFRTGDIIRWDKEGRWWFCDRIGDTYRWKSENVSTAEVSDVLGTHPAVQEANVYGIQLPHHEGRAGCATLVLKGGQDETVLDEVAKHVMERLPPYAVPIFIRVTEKVQTTGTNKQLKQTLRAEGANPKNIMSSGDRVFWLRDGRYVKFDDHAWQTLEAGRAKL